MAPRKTPSTKIAADSEVVDVESAEPTQVATPQVTDDPPEGAAPDLTLAALDEVPHEVGVSSALPEEAPTSPPPPEFDVFAEPGAGAVRLRFVNRVTVFDGKHQVIAFPGDRIKVSASLATGLIERGDAVAL
jgi:hypothetical protein